VAGRQGDCYTLRFWRFLASVARDCKRDIYSRFLHLAIHTLLLFLHITFTHNHFINTCHSISFNNCSFVASFTVLLLFLDLRMHASVLFFCYCLIFAYAFVCCSIAWFPGIVPVGFSSS
jgi:cytochrome bd-type quinol oxidase subunit 2